MGKIQSSINSILGSAATLGTVSKGVEKITKGQAEQTQKLANLNSVLEGQFGLTTKQAIEKFNEKRGLPKDANKDLLPKESEEPLFNAMTSQFVAKNINKDIEAGVGINTASINNKIAIGALNNVITARLRNKIQKRTVKARKKSLESIKENLINDN